MTKLAMQREVVAIERCFHFSSVGAPWGDEKCMEEVMKKLESSGIVKTEIAYPPKLEEPTI